MDYDRKVSPMFNSPIDWCAVCRQWLPLDEECRRGLAESACPLAAARAGTAALMLRRADKIITKLTREATIPAVAR
jgi:hypothetical protein